VYEEDTNQASASPNMKLPNSSEAISNILPKQKPADPTLLQKVTTLQLEHSILMRQPYENSVQLALTQYKSQAI
jgi:hypothetical protein